MMTARETNCNFARLSACMADVAKDVLPVLDPTPLSRPISKGQTTLLQQGRFLLVKEGHGTIEIKGKTTFWVEEGDLIGSWLGDSALSIKADGQLLVTYEYDENGLGLLLTKRPDLIRLWCGFLNECSSVMARLFTEHGAFGDVILPVMVHYEAGDPIIIEGASGEHVFSLVKGRADVISSGTKVGEIPLNEIFGALAAITGEARTASVIANEPCIAMKFDKLTFRDMLRSHPALVTKLAEDMARALKSMNDRVVKLSDLMN